MGNDPLVLAVAPSGAISTLFWGETQKVQSVPGGPDIEETIQFPGPLALFEQIPDEPALGIELEGLFLTIVDEDVSLWRNADGQGILQIESFACIFDPHFLFQDHDTAGVPARGLGGILDDGLGAGRG